MERGKGRCSSDHRQTELRFPWQSNNTKEEEGKRLKQQSVPTSVRRFNASSRSALRRVADSSSPSSLGPGLAAALRLRVVPLAPPPAQQDATATGGDERAAAAAAAAAEDDMAAKEAACRIRMVALSEEAVLKLECCCKGDLALAHRGCAIKWFSIEGDGTCDACSQEVLNLPVTLRRRREHPTIQDAVALVQSQSAQLAPPAMDHTGVTVARHPILVIISTLAYFCFLEQMLVGAHGMARRLWLAISLPFTCVLGTLPRSVACFPYSHPDPVIIGSVHCSYSPN